MALKPSEMTPEDDAMIVRAAKIVLAGGAKETEPEIPADVQKFMDDNNYTIEMKQPTVPGAVDVVDAVRSLTRPT